MFGKGLTKQQNFILDAIVSICRQRKKNRYSKIDVCYWMSSVLEQQSDWLGSLALSIRLLVLVLRISIVY